jgi:hypothetical protein
MQADMSKAEPAMTVAGVLLGNGAAARVCQPMHHADAPATLTEDTQLPAEIIGGIATGGQPPETARAALHVAGSSMLLREPDDVGGRQHDVSQPAVRVTITNYEKHQTVYVLWTNPDNVVHKCHTCSEALFLPCTDATYQPAVGMMHVKPTGLVRLASIPGPGVNAQHLIRLNQRFRAAGGHCFYPGVSLAQVKTVSCVMVICQAVTFIWQVSQSEPHG